MGGSEPQERGYILRGGWEESWERASHRGRGAGLVAFVGQCVSAGSGGKAFQNKGWRLFLVRRIEHTTTW